MSVKIKVIIIGDLAVGKTSLVHICTQGTELSNPLTTIGLDLTKIQLQFDHSNVVVDIWDTSGAEEFRALRTQYYRGSHAVIIVYDITRRYTFKSLDYWITEYKKYVDDNAIILLLGNKKDLEENRQVTTEEGIKYAEAHGIQFYETYKSDPNIETIFVSVLEQISIKKEICRCSGNISVAETQKKESQQQPSFCSNNNIYFNLDVPLDKFLK